ncbi:putative integral membrane protein [Botrytis fragariae]|uniref:Putative integral membrane protein n=1 Tax=Botrytis fragariae TaxID=1964551 RepID=A0A8H6ARP7_9HELO|nr:putative integral membrane protein [Botrytis fragariae]KAF5872397.1 putative integral membrane protein [Botrytis fragariae]
MSTASEILNLPPEVLATIPVGTPPAGVQALSLNPVSRGWLLISVSSILFFMATTCFIIRVYTRAAIQRKAVRSDFILLAGFVMAIIFYIASILLVTSGGTTGVHEWDKSLLELFSKRNLVPFYISAIVVNPAFGLVKLSIFVMYLEIFAGLRWMQICVYIGASFSSAFYLAVTILLFYLSTPFGSETFASKILTPQYDMYILVGIPTSAISFGIDIYLLVLPLIAVSNLCIPRKQKIFVMVGFAVGLLACLGSLLSIIYRVVINRSQDASWNGLTVVLVILVELFCGIMIACFPSLLLFFRRHHEHFAKTGAAISSWLCCTRYRKSNTTIKDSQYSSYPSERTPAGEVNLYPDLDFLTTPGNVERTALEKRMENRIGRDAIAV